MARSDLIAFDGTVTAIHAGSRFEVDIDGLDLSLLCRPGGRLKKFRIRVRVVIGDRVAVEASPFDVRDGAPGRIVYRL